MAKLTAEQQLAKNEKVKAKIKDTKERRKEQQCFVRELKINTSNMSEKDLIHLKMLFIEARWLRNAILSSSDVKGFNVNKIDHVLGFNKEKEVVEKPIKYLSSHMRQEVLGQVKQDISSLSAKKKKGLKVGRLKFVSEVNSINLKQYGNTYQILPNGIKIQGLSTLLKVRGLKQFNQFADCEFANAHLIQKPSGYFLHVAFFVS